jgi:hypothetical protein
VWHERYEKAGLAVVGVHSPEFTWEKPHDKVVEATRKLGVRYPVVQDNDFAATAFGPGRPWCSWTSGEWSATVTSEKATMRTPRP